MLHCTFPLPYTKSSISTSQPFMQERSAASLLSPPLRVWFRNHVTLQLDTCTCVIYRTDAQCGLAINYLIIFHEATHMYTYMCLVKVTSSVVFAYTLYTFKDMELLKWLCHIGIWFTHMGSLWSWHLSWVGHLYYQACFSFSPMHCTRSYLHTMDLGLLRTASSLAFLSSLNLQRKTSLRCWRMMARYCGSLQSW